MKNNQIVDNHSKIKITLTETETLTQTLIASRAWSPTYAKMRYEAGLSFRKKWAFGAYNGEIKSYLFEIYAN